MFLLYLVCVPILILTSYIVGVLFFMKRKYAGIVPNFYPLSIQRPYTDACMQMMETYVDKYVSVQKDIMLPLFRKDTLYIEWHSFDDIFRINRKGKVNLKVQSVLQGLKLHRVCITPNAWKGVKLRGLFIRIHNKIAVLYRRIREGCTGRFLLMPFFLILYWIDRCIVAREQWVSVDWMAGWTGNARIKEIGQHAKDLQSKKCRVYEYELSMSFSSEEQDYWDDTIRFCVVNYDNHESEIFLIGRDQVTKIELPLEMESIRVYRGETGYSVFDGECVWDYDNVKGQVRLSLGAKWLPSNVVGKWFNIHTLQGIFCPLLEKESNIPASRCRISNSLMKQMLTVVEKQWRVMLTKWLWLSGNADGKGLKWLQI